jgi:hypothetical protein
MPYAEIEDVLALRPHLVITQTSAPSVYDVQRVLTLFLTLNRRESRIPGPFSLLRTGANTLRPTQRNKPCLRALAKLETPLASSPTETALGTS